VENADLEVFVRRLIDLSHDLARGHYGQSDNLFALTKAGQYPSLVVELAESLGMMAVKVEARGGFGRRGDRQPHPRRIPPERLR